MAASFYSIIRCCRQMIFSWFFRNNPPSPSFLELKPYLYDTYVWPFSPVLLSIPQSTRGSQTKPSLSVLVPKNTKIMCSGNYVRKQTNGLGLTCPARLFAVRYTWACVQPDCSRYATRGHVSSQIVCGMLHVGTCTARLFAVCYTWAVSRHELLA